MTPATAALLFLLFVIFTIGLVVGISLYRSYRYDADRAALAETLSDRRTGSPTEWDETEMDPPAACPRVVPGVETKK